jgi:hypothetical protein
MYSTSQIYASLPRLLKIKQLGASTKVQLVRHVYDILTEESSMICRLKSKSYAMFADQFAC